MPKDKKPGPDKQARAREKYNKMRAAGMSSKEARDNRYKSEANVKNVIKEYKKQERNARARDNYKQLTNAGFSTKEASRYKFAGAEKIEQAIKSHNLPRPDPKKQGRALLRTNTKQFKASGMFSIELPNTEPRYLKAAFNLMKQKEKEGYIFYSVVVAQVDAMGNESHYSHKTNPDNNLTNSSQMHLISDLQHWEDLNGDYEQLLELYSGKGKYASISAEALIFSMSINLWRPGPGGSAKI